MRARTSHLSAQSAFPRRTALEGTAETEGWSVAASNDPLTLLTGAVVIAAGWVAADISPSTDGEPQAVVVVGSSGPHREATRVAAERGRDRMTVGLVLHRCSVTLRSSHPLRFAVLRCHIPHAPTLRHCCTRAVQQDAGKDHPQRLGQCARPRAPYRSPSAPHLVSFPALPELMLWQPRARTCRCLTSHCTLTV